MNVLSHQPLSHATVISKRSFFKILHAQIGNNKRNRRTHSTAVNLLVEFPLKHRYVVLRQIPTNSTTSHLCSGAMLVRSPRMLSFSNLWRIDVVASSGAINSAETSINVVSSSVSVIFLTLSTKDWEFLRSVKNTLPKDGVCGRYVQLSRTWQNQCCW